MLERNQPWNPIRNTEPMGNLDSGPSSKHGLTISNVFAGMILPLYYEVLDIVWLLHEIASPDQHFATLALD